MGRHGRRNRDASHLHHRGTRGEAGRPVTTRTMDQRAAHTAAEALDIVRSLDVEEAARAVMATVTLECSDDEVRLRAGQGAHTVHLVARRERDLTISLTIEPREGGRLRLPSQEGIPYRSRDPMDLARRLTNAAARRIIAHALGPESESATQATIRLMGSVINGWVAQQETPANEILTLRRLRLETEEMIRALLDPEACRLAAPGRQTVALDQYNHVAGSLDAYRDAMRTNPGAAAIALRRRATAARQQERMSHPGQVISAARGELAEWGVDQAHWRLIAGMSPEAIRALCQSSVSRRTRREALNVCGRQQVRPSASQARRIVQLMSDLQGRADWLETTESERLINSGRAMAIIILKEPDVLDPESVRDMTDYAAALARVGRAVESKTAAGLRRRSDRWHQQQAVEAQERAARQAIEMNGPDPEAWESLVQELILPEGMRATALNDANQLATETIVMKHCVADYTDQCARGQSRIFTVRQGPTPIATIEIRRSRDRWSPYQSRGYRNAGPTAAVRRAARALAAAYQQAWDERHAPA